MTDNSFSCEIGKDEKRRGDETNSLGFGKMSADLVHTGKSTKYIYFKEMLFGSMNEMLFVQFILFDQITS